MNKHCSSKHCIYTNASVVTAILTMYSYTYSLPSHDIIYPHILCLNTGRDPPPEIVIPESTFGSVGTTDPMTDTPTIGTPGPNGGSISDGSGATSATPLYHLILLMAIVIFLL